MCAGFCAQEINTTALKIIAEITARRDEGKTQNDFRQPTTIAAAIAPTTSNSINSRFGSKNCSSNARKNKSGRTRKSPAAKIVRVARAETDFTIPLLAECCYF